MEYKVTRITNGPKHHLFGFHDLAMTNAKGDLALALEVDDISHPPLPGETCRSGVIHLDASNNQTFEQSNNFEAIHSTRTWNYPQGARQQWIGASDLFVCNDREDDGRLVARVSDARQGKVLETLPFPVHCLNAKLGKAVYLNYNRVHAVGGYGYHPLSKEDHVNLVDIPDDDGLWIGDLEGGASGELLISLAQIAACGEKRPVKTGYPHYVTHPMLSPDGSRIVFLHRYRVPDGGETTRLMTVGIDGGGLRCLAKGSLSHFTWIADDEIFIWGKDERALYAMREAAWLRIPGLLQSALLAKKIVRQIRNFKPQKIQAVGRGQDRSFLIVKDMENPLIISCGIGVLTEDGHPMANPVDLRWLVNDTYPNADGDRCLMFYDVDKNERINVGRFRRLFIEPDIEKFDLDAAQAGVDPRIQRKFKCSDYLFYRSGFHCDLHPRWSFDGKTAYFDSIHEGTRQIYAVQG